MISQELKARVNHRLAGLIVIAERQFNRKFLMPTVRYDLTGASRAGWARPSKNLINLNAELMLRNVEETITNTVAHEFAHIVDAIVNPETRQRQVRVTLSGRVRRTKRSIHGPSWKRIMHLFGVKADRCFTHDTFGMEPRVRATKSGSITVRCTCGCGTEGTMGAKRAARWRIKPSRYAFHRGHALVEVKNGVVVGGTPKPVSPPMPLYKPAPAPQPAPAMNYAAPAGGSKQQRATNMVRTHTMLNRKSMIALIALTVGTTEAGASTMYYNARKQLGL